MPRGPALDGAAAHQQVDRIDAEFLIGHADNDQLASGPEAVDGGGQGAGIGEGGEDDPGSAQLLQFGGGVLGGAVDVDVSAELVGEGCLVLPAGNCHGAVAAFGGELHAKMTQAADAEDGYRVARRAPLLRRELNVVMPAHISGAASTSDRSSGMSARGVGRGDDVVGITAVEGDAGDLPILTENEIAAAAGGAVVAMAAVPAQTHALADFVEGHIGSDRIHDAGNLVAGNARIGDAGGKDRTW